MLSINTNNLWFLCFPTYLTLFLLTFDTSGYSVSDNFTSICIEVFHISEGIIKSLHLQHWIQINVTEIRCEENTLKCFYAMMN